MLELSFFMTSEGSMDRYTGERKYIQGQERMSYRVKKVIFAIVPLFKAIHSVYRENKFELKCIKDMKLLFSNFDLTLNKADGFCMKASSNKEIIFIEVSEAPSNINQQKKKDRKKNKALSEEPENNIVEDEQEVDEDVDVEEKN
ncbi:11136_t:CDS:2 [Funneliformis caledonium]|uniref:11136_t:CDS:1 n=1 Tax=Funneliformis caledonium TaxID=1117310 RepID=A0A9N8YYE1_9GLOM|nr:11136_t:CDS:2 [Funneliformis caledonium]